MNDVVDTELETPCPNCGGKLMTIKNKDESKLFMNLTKYIVYCTACDFEEHAEQFQERLNKI